MGATDHTTLTYEDVPYDIDWRLHKAKDVEGLRDLDARELSKWFVGRLFHEYQSAVDANQKVFRPR